VVMAEPAVMAVPGPSRVTVATAVMRAVAGSVLMVPRATH
jgi:hypothetical protein